MTTTQHSPTDLLYVRHDLTKGQVEKALRDMVSKATASTKGKVTNRNILHVQNNVTGTVFSVTRSGRQQHRIEIISGPLYGQRFRWHEVVNEEDVDDRVDYILDLLNTAKIQLSNAFIGDGNGTLDIDAVHQFFNDPDAEQLLIDAWGSLNLQRSFDERSRVVATLLFQQSDYNAVRAKYGHCDPWVVHLALYETWVEIKHAIEGAMDMKKTADAMVWWVIEGDPKKLKGLTVSLNRSRNYVVMDTPRRIYLRIQKAETKFVTQHTSSHNLLAKRIHDEPLHVTAACGKYVTDLAAHTQGSKDHRRCKACQTLMQNDQNATTSKTNQTTQEKDVMAGNSNRTLRPHDTAPAVPPPNAKAIEQSEWKSKNGDVIVIQGPTTGIDPLDFPALAADYRRVSNDLLARSAWYEETAQKYDALSNPSSAVQQAEQALKEAQANEASERQSQIAALQKLLTDGPPESAD